MVADSPCFSVYSNYGILGHPSIGKNWAWFVWKSLFVMMGIGISFHVVFCLFHVCPLCFVFGFHFGILEQCMGNKMQILFIGTCLCFRIELFCSAFCHRYVCIWKDGDYDGS